MNGDTIWCSDKYYSVLHICVMNTDIMLFPRHIKPTFCHCKVVLTYILARWGLPLDSFPPKALPIALFLGFRGGKITMYLYV